jgi:hypothetical protein
VAVENGRKYCTCGHLLALVLWKCNITLSSLAIGLHPSVLSCKLAVKDGYQSSA